MIFLKKIVSQLNTFKTITFNVFSKYKELYIITTLLLIFFNLMSYMLSSENAKGNTQTIITTYIFISVSVTLFLFVFVISLPIYYIDEYKRFKQLKAQKHYDDLRLYLTNRIIKLGKHYNVTFLYVSKELFFINPYNNIHNTYNYVFIIDKHRHGKSAGLYKCSAQQFNNVSEFFEYE